MLHCKSLSPMTILEDDITSNAFDYRVSCHQDQLRFNSALMYTVIAMSKSLYAPLGRYFGRHMIIIVL
jgi:hypothetical protein